MTTMLTAVIWALLLLLQNSSPPPAQPQAATRAPLPAQSSPSTERGFRIAGVVVDASSGQPLGSAAVAIAPLHNGEERGISKSVVTGPDGRFAFSGLSQSKYSLVGRARGYTLQGFERHDDYATAIAVGPDLDSEHLMFPLQPDASIDGEVTDENNDPVQYAMVRLFSTKSRDGLYTRTAPVEQTQTDDQGHYHIGHLEPGAYYLSLSARPWYAQNVRTQNGYNPNFNSRLEREAPEPEEKQAKDQEDAALDVTYPLTFYPDATSLADATPLQLAPGAKETANIVLRSVPSLHLRIHTGGSAQNAVIGHMIFPRISQRIFGDYLDSVYNAPDSWVAPGVIEISGLAPGRYVVEVPPSSGSEKVVSRGWYREIDLTGDADISASDAPGFVSVSGTILFENAPVPRGASIQLLNPDTGERFTTDISTKGEFDFPPDNVKAGRHLLLLGGGHGFYIKRVAATGATVNGRAIEIAPGGNVHLAVLASGGAARVDGTAIHDDSAFAGAMIVLVPQDPANNAPLFRRDQSDSDGTFTLSEVVPGQYTVIAIANGWDLDWSNPAVLQPYLKRGQSVQVSPNGKLQVKVQVQ